MAGVNDRHDNRAMPTIHREGRLRFVIHSQDHPPPHVHVKGLGNECRIRLADVVVIGNAGFTSQELRRILDSVRARVRDFEEQWHGIHGQNR